MHWPWRKYRRDHSVDPLQVLNMAKDYPCWGSWPKTCNSKLLREQYFCLKSVAYPGFFLLTLSLIPIFTDENKTEGDKTGERASDLHRPGRLISAGQRTLSNQATSHQVFSLWILLESSFAKKADQLKSPKINKKKLSAEGWPRRESKSYCILDWQLALWKSYYQEVRPQ